MENKHIISGLIGIVIIGALTGLILEIMIEGDAAKFRQFAQKIKDNTLILFETAQLATVQNMISHATVAFELSTAIADPDSIPNNGDEYFLNQVSECVFFSPEDIPFPTCLICQLSDQKCMPKVMCPECEKPTIFTVRYDNPSQMLDDVVRIEVVKGNNLLAEFDGVMDGDEIEIDSRNFLSGSKNEVEANTEYLIIINGAETTVIIHTSCSKDLFVGDVHTRESNTGDPNVSLTVVSGMDANFNPTIPDAICKPTCPGCKKPTELTVAYDGPNPGSVTVEIYKDEDDVGISDKLLLTTEVNGEGNIVINSNDFLDKNGNPKPRDTLHSQTTYRIIDSGVEIAVISFHTSCSQPEVLIIGNTFADGPVFLTLVGGIAEDGSPAIPDGTCEEPINPGASVLLEGKKILPDGYVAGTLESIPLPTGPEHPENDVQDVVCVTLLVCGQNCPECEKPTIFTVRYDNPNQMLNDVVRIEVVKGNNLLAEFDGVMDGDEIEIDSRDFLSGSKNTVEANTEYHIIINGAKTTVIIHTSCSKDLFVGDVHTRESNTEDPNVSLTVVSGMDANFNPTIPDASCRDPCTTCEKPTIFTVQYDNPSQIPDDVVRIEVVKGNNLLAEFDGVMDGDEIEIDSRDFLSGSKNTVEANTEYLILINGAKTTVIIHTSCSDDLFVGDVHTRESNTEDPNVSLTVVSGTDGNLNPTIPDASCRTE